MSNALRMKKATYDYARITCVTRLAVAVAVACGAFVLLAVSSARADSAEENSTKWQIETVDASGAGKFTSLKVDKDGNVHVAYSIEDGNVNPLKYAIRAANTGRWFSMPVASGAAACSLALDSKQRPHISWDDFGSGAGAKLRYAYWDGMKWHTEAIRLNSVVISYYNSLALDPQDHPAISFYEYQGPPDTDFRIRLRSVIWDGQNWDLRTVDGEPGSGKFNSMVADSKGHLHIAYANVSATTAGIRYAYWDGKSWELEVLEGMTEAKGDSVGYSAAIALDKEGDPHLTYMNETTPGLKYAVRKSGRWQIQNVDALSRVAYPDRNSIAIDDQGRTYIGYYDAGRGILKLAHEDGTKWITEVVDSNGAGFTSSLDIANGSIWMSYSDESGALKVAHRILSGSSTGGTPTQSPRQKD
jgi:hypothetical protein